VSERKTERLLNLVIALLHTRRYLSVQEIRAAVPGYEQGAEESFRRMFERDKEELRELGVPLETGTNSHAHYDEPGYRIARRDYELPDIALEPDEAAALGLAARLWQSAPLAGATGSALLKLRAAGVEASAPAALEPRVGASEPAFDACLAAVRDGRAVRFAYRTGGAPPRDHSVEPYGVVSWRGRWYLVGRDTEKDAERVFRLSRVAGPVTPVGPHGAVVPPEGLDLRARVVDMVTRLEQPVGTARVSLRPGAGWELRREASAEAPDPDREGWTVVELGFSDPERLADRVTGFGADAVVLSPPEARDAVVRRLEALVAR
jgi:proteasome accessory factor B